MQLVRLQAEQRRIASEQAHNLQLQKMQHQMDIMKLQSEMTGERLKKR